MISSNIRIPEELWEKLKKISEKEERRLYPKQVELLFLFINHFYVRIRYFNTFFIKSFLYYII